jgi:fructoselysine-6-P-deglycase FrlB-like protein
MGSSCFAAGITARRLRARGVVAVAERSSAEHVWPPMPGDVLVAVSAGGSSVETLALAEHYAGTDTAVIALTNRPGSPLADRAVADVPMSAGSEVSGVSVRSFLATLVRLLQLEEVLTGADLGLPPLLLRAADAVDELLETSTGWIEDAAARLVGPDGTWLLAPSGRISSAQQGALMLREAPRRAAGACETGDWSHVDVYLTKTLDYRALVFAGSRWDAAAAEWMIRRRSTYWVVGDPGPVAAATVAGAARTLRYVGDSDPLVALLAETTVAELLAAHLVTAAPATV